MSGMKVSYRQTGKLPGGRIVKGPPPAISSVVRGVSETPAAFPSMRPRPVRSKPSIPSKFETTLHVGQRERDAFGGRTLRFRPPDNELPGPGNYHKPTTLIRQFGENGSVSKKGFGVGFVSKTKRFSDRDVRVAMSQPAPGSYEAKPLGRMDHSRAQTSANFARPRKYRDATTIDFRPSPGPGEYDSARAFTAPHPVRAYTNTFAISGSSTFKSHTKRDSYLSKENGVPAPGTYDTPEAPAIPGGTIFKSIPDRLKILYPMAHQTNPGPGAYRPRSTAAGTVTVKDPVRSSSMFSNTQHDRYGVPYVRKTTDSAVPGPGAYSADVVAEKPKLSAASSMFLSSSQRGFTIGGKKQVRPPGPAFYKPDVVGKKSFLLNPSSKFV